MKSNLLALACAAILGGAILAQAQVARGELEEWKGFVMTSVNESTRLALVTLSAGEADAQVQVGFLMDPATAARVADIKGVAELHYTGEMSVLIKLKTKEQYMFMVEGQAPPPNTTGIRVAGIQRLGFKPRAFMNHSEAASQVFQSFKAVPSRPSRDKKPPVPAG